VCAVCRLLCRGPNVTHVAASIGLGDGQADSLVAGQDLREDLVLQLLAGILEQRGRADDQADEQRGQPTRAQQLIPENQVVEPVPLGCGDVADNRIRGPLRGNRPAKRNRSQKPGGSARGINRGVDGTGVPPVLGVRRNVLSTKGVLR